MQHARIFRRVQTEAVQQERLAIERQGFCYPDVKIISKAKKERDRD
jgi:hypothetical protein